MLTIGEVARACGINASAIRYYERKGVLPAADRIAGRRRYDARILELLRVVDVAKRAGFTLTEIKLLLHGFEPHATPSERWRALAGEKLAEIEALIARAEGMRALLKRGLDCGCLTLDDCALLG